METQGTDYTGLIDRRTDERFLWAFAALLLLLHAALAWGAREPGLLTAQDDARYMLLGRALRDFTYRDLYLVGQPLHGVYPPGLPALLAVWGAIAGEGFTSFVVPSVLLSTAALGLLFLSVRRVWSPTGALLSLACLAVNPWLVARAGGVRSEPLYMFLSLLCLWALTRHRDRPIPVSGVDSSLLLAGAAAIFAALTRTIGVSLIGAVFLGWLLRRRYKAAVAFAIASLLTVGAWLVWSAVSPGQIEGFHYYADVLRGRDEGLFGALVARVTRLAPQYGGLSLPYMLPVPLIRGTPIDNAFWAVVVSVGVLAGLFELFRRWPVAALYLPLYAMVLVLWPYELSRFLEPVIPLLLPALLLGLALLASRLGRRWSLAAVAVMSVAIMSRGATMSLDRLAQRQACGEFSIADPPSCLQSDRASYLRAVAYIEERTPSEAVFLTAKPEALYYYTGRRSVLLESVLGSAPESFTAELAARSVGYVILGSLHHNEIGRLHDLVGATCAEFRLEASFEPRTYLLRLARDSLAATWGEVTPQAADPIDACEAVEAHGRANAGRTTFGSWLNAP